MRRPRQRRQSLRAGRPEGPRAGEIAVVSRSGEDNYANLDRHSDAALLINTTPVSMYPNNGETPVPLDAFPRSGRHRHHHKPRRTALLLDAESRGIPCLGGLPMLVGRAARAAGCLRGLKSPTTCLSPSRGRGDEKHRPHRDARLRQSSVGRELARRPIARLRQRRDHHSARRKADSIFSPRRRSGISQNGHGDPQGAFRTGGAVIATGGGVVKRRKPPSPV